MGNFASRVHSKEDGKVYNILPLGDMPTVVFGRRLKKNSVPGMQYYFRDGRVKWQDGGDDFVKPFLRNHDDISTRKWGIPCIFTVPEDYDWNKVSSGDYNYIKSCCRTADRLNANTVSPNYIIRDGELICVKTIGSGGKYVIVKEARMQTYNNDWGDNAHRRKITGGKMISIPNTNNGEFLHELNKFSHLRNTITIIPVGRVKHKKYSYLPNNDSEWEPRYHCKKSIYHYKLRKLVVIRGTGRKDWVFKMI